MVANNRDLTVQFKGDSTSIEHASEQSSRALGKVGDAASGHGGLLSKLTPVIDPISLATQGIELLTHAAMSFVDAGIAGAKSAAALDGVLKNVTHSTGAQIDAQEKWLTGLSNQVGIIDDELRPAYARLVAATHDTITAQTDLKLALDVAAGTGKDYNAVVDAMVKASNGNEGALGRLGVAVKDVHGKLLPLPQVIQNLHDKYDGLAASVANQDPVTKLGVAWHNISEQIGTALLPYVQDAVNWIINKLIPAVELFAGWVKANWPAIRDILAKPFHDLKGAIDDLAASLTVLSGGDGKGGKLNLAKLGMLFLTAQAELLAFAVEAIAIQLRGISYAVDIAWISLKFLADKLTGPMISAVGFLGQAFLGLGRDIAKIATGIWQAFRDAFNFIIKAWNATLGKLSFHIPGTGIGFDVPSIPTINAGTLAATAPGSTGSVINVNLPSGTDGHSIVAALRTYNVRVGGLDLALHATR